MSQLSGNSLTRLGLAADFPDGMRVMAIDPDSESLNILKDLLIQCKFTVLPEQSAKNALQRVICQKEDCQLVVTEYSHDMDPFQFVKLMARRAPVVVLSCMKDNSLVVEAILAGADDYMSKPATVEMMKPIWQYVVKRLLKKNRLERIPNCPNPINHSQSFDEVASQDSNEPSGNNVYTSTHGPGPGPGPGPR